MPEQVLYYDLTTASSRCETIPQGVYRDHPGGLSLAAYYLAGLRGPAVALARGPFAGTPIPGANACALLGRAGDGRLGLGLYSGELAIALRKAGLAALVLTGAAPEPVGILVEDTMIYRVTANFPVICSSSEASAHWRKQWGMGRPSLLVTGPAGWSRASLAGLFYDGGQQLERGGLGKVFAELGLSAVAIEGNCPVEAGPVEDWLSKCREYTIRSRQPVYDNWRQVGSVHQLLVATLKGRLPAANYRSGSWTPAAEWVKNLPRQKGRNIACPGCTLSCRQVIKFGAEYVYPGYDDLAAMGASLGIEKLEEALHLLATCRRLGLEPVATGVALAGAAEALQEGYLDADATGFSLHTGEQRLGALGILARGTAATPLADGLAALGGDRAPWAMQLKGHELPPYHPGRLLPLAVGLSGRSGWWSLVPWLGRDIGRETGDPVEEALALEKEAMVADSLGFCRTALVIYPDFDEEVRNILELAGLEELDLAHVGRKALQVWEKLMPDKETARLPERIMSVMGEDGLTALVNKYRHKSAQKGVMQ